MANAAILKTIRVIQTDNLSKLAFDLDGYLVQFNIGDIVYKHVEQDSFRKDDLKNQANPVSAGYYTKDSFLKYLTITKDINILKQHALEKNISVKYAKKDDDIKVQKLVLKMPYDNFCTVGIYNFKYSGNINDVIDPSNLRIKVPDNIEPISIKLNNLFVAATDFYKNKISLLDIFLGEEEGQAAVLIAKIALVINMINKEIFPMFNLQGADNLSEFTISQNEEWVNGNIFNNPTLDDLNNYYNNILGFYKTAYSNQLLILDTPGFKKLYWLAMGLSAGNLSILPVEYKWRLLEYISKNLLSKIYERTTQEELVVKIALSFNNNNTITQIDPFLDQLLVIKPDEGSDKTLYETLYRQLTTTSNTLAGTQELSNWVFNTQFKPTKTKEQFVQALYALWTYSKYNPYTLDGSIKPSKIAFKELDPNLASFSYPNNDLPQSEFYYTHVTSYDVFPFETSPNYVGPPLYIHKEIRKTAAPILMPYESEKFIGIYFDNFNFKISGKTVLAYQDLTQDYRYGNDDPNKEVPIPIYRDTLYGNYHIYQPVSLLNANIDSKVAFTTVDGDDVNVNGENINSLIPIFLLEFIDSAGDRSDAETILGYALDVVSLVGGVTNLAKLRHLRWAATGTETVGLFTLNGMRIVVGGVEFTADVLGVMANFVTCEQGDEFCESMKKYISILQMSILTLNSVDSLASLIMKKQAATVIEAAGGGVDEAEIIQNIKNKLNDLNTPGSTQAIENTAAAISNIGKDLFFSSLLPIPINVITQFINKVIDRVIVENARFYWRRKDLVVGIPSTNYPRFSTRRYVADGFEIVSGKRVQRYRNTGDFLNNTTELKEMAEHGRALGLGDINTPGNTTSVTESLIIKSYRIGKQETKIEVMNWMTNYHNFLTVRNKVPFCFSNQSHFQLFINEFKTIINKYGFGNDLKEITITGSSLTKVSPPDLDLINKTMNKAQIKAHLNRLEKNYNLAKEAEKVSDKLISKIESSFKTSFSEGKIRPECMVRFENEVFYTLKNELENMVNQPITVKGKFDFNIFPVEDELRNLPPSHDIILN
ncbi:hypothetical protein [Pedobacter glucosidilyticus]|uniref:hypothetical protein n=1 Tax=Pedobacter glucosidilyticus TaxID=1122941 RepID=UPI000408507A|nr:hypothetical protein [Pedobacter glucosidilyticus]